MRITRLLLASLLGLGVAACGGVDGTPGEGTDDTGVAAEPQLSGGTSDYVIYTLQQNSTVIGKVLATNTAHSPFAANTEYWYMYANVTTSFPLYSTGGASSSWSVVPVLGTLSFKMNRTATWTSGTPAGSMFEYYNTDTKDDVLVDWHMINTGGTWTGEIIWWHNKVADVWKPGIIYGHAYKAPNSEPNWYYYIANPL